MLLDILRNTAVQGCLGAPVHCLTTLAVTQSVQVVSGEARRVRKAQKASVGHVLLMLIL